MRVGLISDTHGLLRPEALAALAGCEHIIHAGDIGNGAIVEALRAVAPLTVVRGNNDTGPWARAIPEADLVQLGPAWVYVLHDLALLDIDPVAAGVDAVIAGHSHQPRVDHRDGVLYVNPGSAGPRRFTLPISVGYLIIGEAGMEATLRTLEIPK